MSELASRLPRLAVPVDLQLRFAPQNYRQLSHRVNPPPQDVGHNDMARAHPCRAKRQTRDCTQMVLELAGDCTIDRPVPGVVRAHRQFVDDDRVIPTLHELNGKHPHHAKRLGNVTCHLRELRSQADVEVGGGRDSLDADSVALNRLRDGIRHRLAIDATHYDHGQFACEIDELLGDHCGYFGTTSKGHIALAGLVELPDTVAVVAAARGLSDNRPPLAATPRDQLVSTMYDAPARARKAGGGEHLAHNGLILSVDLGTRRGPKDMPRALKLDHQLRRHMLMVKGDDVNAVSEGAHDVDIVWVPDDSVVDDGDRRRVDRLRKQAQREPESDSSLRHHARQLPATDDAHHGKIHRPILRSARPLAPLELRCEDDAMSATFVTMGGGGFSMGEGATAIDRYLLELTGKASPLVCFAPTASADDPQYINKFLVAFGALGVRSMILTLWDGARTSVDRLPEADLIYVGGGSTVNLIALWDAHGVTSTLRQQAADSDVVLAGLSAGGSCWYEGFTTDSFGDIDPYRRGIGLLPGSFCPHFDGEAKRAPAYASWVADGTLPAGYGADDGAAVVWRDGKIVEHIAERPSAATYYVRPSNNPGGSGVLSQAQEMHLL